MNKKKEYSKYIHSKQWKERRDRIRRERKRCEICNSEEELQVHHLSYENIGHEKDEDVVLLCKKCHYGVHKGVYIIFPHLEGGKLPKEILRGLNYTKIKRIYFPLDKVLYINDVVIEKEGKEEIYNKWCKIIETEN